MSKHTWWAKKTSAWYVKTFAGCFVLLALLYVYAMCSKRP